MFNLCKKLDINYTLKQDRFISFDEPKITIGICGKKHADDKLNPLSHQCIRINDNDELYSLKTYIRSDTSICYEFEKDIRLCFIKHEKDILYNLKTKNIDTTQQMDNDIINNFKPLMLASKEFDMINDFIKS
jgi:hypothetical protein